MTIDVSNYISGGYFLTKLIPRPDGISDLIPSTIVTLSNCFTQIAPDDWADSGYNYDAEERNAEAKKFGIDASVVPELVDHFTQAVAEHHITTAFPCLAVAREFYQLCEDKSSAVLVGIGLHRSLLPSLYRQKDDHVNRGYDLFERVDANTDLEAGGEPLGYEILGFEATKFHSWLCHNSPVEAHDNFGVKPNGNGFIDSLTDAVRITEYVKANGAEPAVWEPWLVVRYGASDKA